MNISLFWSKKLEENDTYDDWINRKIKLSFFHEVTLLSHLKFGNKVYLYTYQKIDRDIFNIPDEIIICDANDFFPSENAFKALQKGHSIAHISDLIRLRSAIELQSVVMDIDNIVINKFPDLDCFTSTLAAKLTGSMAIKFGKTQQPFKIHDNSWDGKALSVFPIKVHKIIEKEIFNLSNRIEETLKDNPLNNTKGWNYVVWTLKDIANTNKNVYVMKPINFCPVPAWKSAGNCYSLDSPTKFDGKTVLFGYTMPSIEQIFKETYAVQHFFESAFKKSDPLEKDFWLKIKDNCLLDHELKLILGNDWKYKKEIELNKENKINSININDW